LAQGAKPYLLMFDEHQQQRDFPYPQLIDGDRTHRGWNGSGPWGDASQVSGICSYRLGLPETAELNTIVVYFRQDDGTEEEPTESTVFTQHGLINFDVIGLENDQELWPPIEKVVGNGKVKRTFNFPRRRFTAIEIVGHTAAGTGPAVVEIELFNR
jgi:hypothetical protein